MGRVWVALTWLSVGTVIVLMLSSGSGCQDCEMPSNVSTTYSCQALSPDSPRAACAGGPTPQMGGAVPDADKRFAVGCTATQSTCGTASPSTSTTTRTCTCEGTSQRVDAGPSSGNWVCQ